MGTATYFAVTLPIFIGISAFVIDLGLINYERSNLQLAADSAALASVEYLEEENNNFDIINNQAILFATYHKMFGSNISSEQVLTQIGYLTIDGDFIEDVEGGNCVKVTVENDNLPAVFGSIFGYHNYQVMAHSIVGKVSVVETQCVPVMNDDWPCLMFASSSLELTGNFNIRVDEPLSNSSLCTNSSVITLGGNLSIQNGIDLHMGPSCPYNDGISCIDPRGNSYVFNGESTPMAAEFLLPEVEYPESYLPIPSPVRSGRNMVTNLNPGSIYFVDQDLTMNANQSINIFNSSRGCSEPAILYVDGDVSLSGGVTGNLNHPECFEIRVIGERTVRINGRSTFYGNIYAPNSEVYPNGNSDFHGTLMADIIRANGNNTIILDTGYLDSVPITSDEMTCENKEIEVDKIRVFQ